MRAKKPLTAKLPAKSAKKNLDPVYSRLCEMFTRHKGKLSVAVKKPGTLWMAVTGAMYRGKPLFYGGVKMGKNYVSYHLMSIYMLDVEISPELNKRKQGKACFNFAEVDEKLFGELDRLTVAAMKDFTPEILEKRLAAYKTK